jgi:hypothetical protein
MNTPEVERLVSAALHADAEDAMSRTSTTEQLQSHIEASERDTRERRRLRVVGALIAVAAAAVVGVTVTRSGGDDGSAPPVGPPTKVERRVAAEQVAREFLEDLAIFDRTDAATYVAPGAELTMGNILDENSPFDAWALRNRWDEATGWKVTAIDACNASLAGSAFTTVRCQYTAHQLGSDELGRGPFGGNEFVATVRDGAIVNLTLATAHNTNEFAGTMWEPFWAWMQKTHPDDEPRMAAVESPDASPAQVNSSLALWHRHVQQYVDAVRAGDAE